MEKYLFFKEKEKELNGPYRIIDFINIPGFSVYQALNLNTTQLVAIQEVSEVFEDKKEAQRAYVEIKIFKLLQHNNISNLKKFISPPIFEDFNKFFIVAETLDSTLDQIISNPDILLTANNRRFIIFQILNALKYLHSAHIVVKSMSPLNLFVDSYYNTKFLLFGIEQFQKPHKTSDFRYKAPEIFFLNNRIDTSADIWSVGCIFYSLITKKNLFQGNSLIEQINSIVNTIGNLTEVDLSFIDKQIIDGIININPNMNDGLDWKDIIPNALDEEIELIKSMLVWDPSKRITAAAALKKRYFNSFHYFYDTKTTVPIDLNDTDHLKIEELKQKIWNEIQNK